MMRVFDRVAKRSLDVFFSVIALIAALPFLLAIAVLVLATLGAPVLFRQSRPGLHGKPFVILKFRTMKDTADARGIMLSDEKRLIKSGGFLRRTSLDELPEFWNVLKGNMSLVGPRPLKMEYLDRYTPHQARRHQVKPGITGWAQVNGRNALSWEERFELDVWYVDHQSLWLDIKILLKTIAIVLKREGISAEGHATMPEFMGSRPSETSSLTGRGAR